jgi:glycosyltransferase involved in cell wall biosynthesis
MSHSVQEEIRSFDRKKPVRFAPHPVYDNYGSSMKKADAREQLHIPEDVKLVLFFGFIRKYKGLDLLLEALAETPGIHALVAGECYEDWAFYQQIIDRHHLKDRLYLHMEFIPADQVRVFFSAADLVVQPYRSATQSGISQIAYHFEQPMVVTRVGGLPEIVTDGVSGYVVDAEPQAIASAITDFFDNQRDVVFQEGIRKEKQRFSWEYLSGQLLNIS